MSWHLSSKVTNLPAFLSSFSCKKCWLPFILSTIISGRDGFCYRKILKHSRLYGNHCIIHPVACKDVFYQHWVSWALGKVLRLANPRDCAWARLLCGMSKMLIAPSGAPHTVGWGRPSIPHEKDLTSIPAVVSPFSMTSGDVPPPAHCIDPRSGKWGVLYTPRMKARTNLLYNLKEVFQRFISQPVERVIEIINPKLRGWVNYFRIGHSSRCFQYIKDWVEKKIRRHLMKARNRKGFGWDRWSRVWFYRNLGLYADYKVRPQRPESAASW